ncbi:hypothetical protein [Peribacillus sp. NPDC058075]|uniref:hypothetical protein n=1 Tax=unclassified Peribacillus TaxID=2675266 RepID=UPI0036DE4F3F
MEESQYLRTWQEELERENVEHQRSLDKFLNEREMLLAKRGILSEIFFQSSSNKEIEKFKVHSGYNEIVSSLEKLEGQTQYELEENLRIKIRYNKHIISKIKLQVQ